MRSFARIPIELTIDGDDRPPAEVAGEVLRVAQEALSNALRHASASNVSVRLVLDTGRTRLRVTDDGVGVPPDMTPGVGLGGMRSRAGAIGGTLSIAPGRECGTIVELEVPWEPAVKSGVAGSTG